jgi:hypothetical protein
MSTNPRESCRSALEAHAVRKIGEVIGAEITDGV